MSIQLASQVAALQANLSGLPQNDQTFASSLVNQFGAKHSLSDKQAYWVGKLLSKVQPAAAETAAPTADKPAAAGAWQAFFNAVPRDAKRPAVIVALGNPEEPGGALKIEGKKGGTYLRLMFQSVPEGGKPRAGAWVYIGTLREAGEVRFGYGVKADKGDVLTALQMLAEDTIAVLKKTGIAFGICANCGRLLTHPASIAFGIGPVCSTYLGLAAQYAAVKAGLSGEGF
jgi:hypothetical protein